MFKGKKVNSAHVIFEENWSAIYSVLEGEIMYYDSTINLWYLNKRLQKYHENLSKNEK